jgi:ubiquitin carboxyl-terminal hydrolase L5
MSEEWCTIESDPGVFTALCEEIGVKGVQFEEIFSLGPEAFINLDVEKIYGFVFLFKWTSGPDERPTVEAADHGLFFAQQVIQNACATQAILSVLLNAPAEKLEVGPHLKEFKEFTNGLDTQTKGLAVSNSEPIRKAHNSFRHQSSFEIVQEKDAKGEDPFHFIGYVCHAGSVYELDGLKKGPILIGQASDAAAFCDKAREEVQRRIETMPAKEGADSELRFNLMAITASRLGEAQKAVEREQYLRHRANICLVSRGEDVELVDEVDDDDAPATIPSFEDLSQQEVSAVKKIVEDCSVKITEMSKVVEEESRKRQKWERENSLRRSDLVPLALCAMRHLAKKGQLLPALEKGKAAHLKRLEEKKKAKGEAVAA